MPSPVTGGSSPNVFLPIKEVSSNYTALLTDCTILCNASSGGFTITLPPIAEAPGHIYHIKKVDSSGNVITVDGSGSETVEDSASQTIDAEWESIHVQAKTNGWVII